MNAAASRAAFWLANLCGLAAFAWPLLLAPAGPSGEARAHAVDAPVLVALLIPLMVFVAVDEARRGGGDARVVAVLGALVAVNTIVRIPKGPSGESLVFVLPILAGWSLGGRFAFLLGGFSALTSALLTGGVGPWLPFQMLAIGWVGMGAAAARKLVGGRAPVLVLAAYGYVSSVAYGFAINLWFWPFMGRVGPVFFEAGLGLSETLARYLRFYLATSLPWDTGRALLGTVPALAVLTRPVVALLDRTLLRLHPVISSPPSPPPSHQGDADASGVWRPPASRPGTPDGLRASSPTTEARP